MVYGEELKTTGLSSSGDFSLFSTKATMDVVVLVVGFRIKFRENKVKSIIFNLFRIHMIEWIVSRPST